MSCAPCAERGAVCGGECASPARPIATTFGAATRLFAGPGLRGGLAVRPAGDAASDEAARLAAERAASARAAELAAGVQLGTQTLSGANDALAREQRRAQSELESRTQERIAELNANRDIELARIRATAAMTPATSPGAPEFSVLGLASTQGQVVNASPVAAQPAGVMGWIRENPVMVGIGVAGVAAAAYFVLRGTTKGRRRR
ncbi:MAG: hypothetical protein Q8Q09_01690 [Deltaproteobacteria bacterium]|nr:hypothetical protein [Deltaproteobacteria bacterium]